MIVLDRNAVREKHFTIDVDPQNPYEPPAKGAEGLEQITWYHRPFTGHDSRRFSDSMMVMDKKGAQKFAAGTLQAEKLKAATTKIENLGLKDGAPIRKLTDDLYDVIPAWILEIASREINRSNAVDEEEEGN